MNLGRYSQHGEEELVEKYLSNVERGTYVDIGSGDPTEINNTIALYRIGWHGVLVEPFTRYHNPIMRERPNDKLCGKVITNRVGRVEMFDTASVDTFIGQDYKEKGVRFDGQPHEKYIVDCYTMKEFLEEYPEVKEPDFASVDIETGEEALFSCCDFNVFKPKLLCVEYKVRGIDYRPNWQHYLTPFYESKELLGGNAFYLRK